MRSIVAGLLCLLLGGVATAQVPADLQLTPFAAGLDYPLAIRSPRDGSGRVFVLQQCDAGQSGSTRNASIRVFDRSGAALGTFLTVAVTCPSPGGGEQGLLGLAFDPNFNRDPGQPGYGDFYLALTAPGTEASSGSQPDQVVRRYTLAAPSSNDASAAVAVDVIRIADPYSNHNGGDIHFGPDGYLYYGMGDGGSGGDPNGFAQCLKRKAADANPLTCGTVAAGQVGYALLGKLLRLDVHHTTTIPSPLPPGWNLCGLTAPNATRYEYAIPPDNPYAGDPLNGPPGSPCAEIYAYGLRNPFRFSFDRATGALWIGDVGQNAWEEIDWQVAPGSNFGWACREGNAVFRSTGECNPVPADLRSPLLVYSHSGRCSVTGGFRYRGAIGALGGSYAFGDYCSGQVYLLHPSTGSGASTCPAGFDFGATTGWTCTLFAPSLAPTTVAGLSSFGEDGAGNLYVTGVRAGATVYRFDSPDAIWANSFDW